MTPVSRHDLALSKAEFPLDSIPEALRGKHILRIIWDLRHEARRFGEIRKSLSSTGGQTKALAPRVLSRELKSLADLGLIHRRAYNVIPPKVEYRLTALGRTLLPVISVLLEWRRKHPLARTASKEFNRMPSSRVAGPSSKNFHAQVCASACVFSSQR